MKFDSATMLELAARIRFGDHSAYAELVRLAGQRLEFLVRRMLRRYPDVARWEEVEDVLQGALQRLWAALQEVTPDSTRSFANLAACLIQRELIDLARHYRGRHWVRATLESDAPGGEKLCQQTAATSDPDAEIWMDWHEGMDRLSDDLREVAGLVLYAGLPLAQAAATLGVSERTVQRKLAQAIGRLQALLVDQPTTAQDRNRRSDQAMD